jgi:hypothetical protein
MQNKLWDFCAKTGTQLIVRWKQVKEKDYKNIEISDNVSTQTVS